MSRKQPADDKSDAVAFATIDREINSMVKRLHGRGACPCCISAAMIYRGAFLHAEVAGVEDTISLCMDAIDTIEGPGDGVMPASDTQH